MFIRLFIMQCKLLLYSVTNRLSQRYSQQVRLKRSIKFLTVADPPALSVISGAMNYSSHYYGHLFITIL